MDDIPVDLTSAAFKRDPISTFRELRTHGALVRVKLPLVGRCWMTTTYEAANHVLRDNVQFGVDPKKAGRKNYAGVQWWMPRTVRAMANSMLSKDEPDHRRLRSLVESAFVRQSIDEMRPRIELLADRQLDLLERNDSKGQVDALSHFARPFPLTVICELLGLPEQDRAKFLRWGDMANVRMNPLSLAVALRGFLKIAKYLRRQFEVCRVNPRPGMISALVAAEEEGGRLSEDELLAAAFILLIAGHETTVHLLTSGILAFNQHPQQKQRMLGNWSLLPGAVDEVLRYASPVQMTKPRYARQDVELFGTTVRRGEFVTASLSAANCDPNEFERPEEFDILRTDNHHIGFGTGIHVCLGLKLAKAEAEIAFQRMYSRFPNLEVAIPFDEIRWTQRLGLRAVKSLPLRLNGD